MGCNVEKPKCMMVAFQIWSVNFHVIIIGILKTHVGLLKDILGLLQYAPFPVTA